MGVRAPLGVLMGDGVAVVLYFSLLFWGLGDDGLCVLFLVI